MTQLTKGMIILWSGAEAAIPAGWHLCDGTLDTVDLRNKFIVGAGDTYDVAAAAGAIEHVHIVTQAPHAHGLWGEDAVMAGTDLALGISETTATSTVDTVNHLPPYYALCYIQKL